MKLQLRNLICENILKDGYNHLKNNYGKYATGAAAGAAGLTSVAGEGLLGVEAQDAVQNTLGKAAWDLENRANANHIKGYKDSAIEVLTRPDNILNPDNTMDDIKYQNYLQKEHYLGAAQGGLAKGLRVISGTRGSPDDSGDVDFVIRNPITSVEKVGEGINKAAKAILK